MNIEIRHLKTLIAIAETGTLVDAADQVHLTQSALSHQIKELESRAGQTLFFRKTKPIRFTAAGERLLEAARTVIPALESAERDLFRMQQGQSGRLHIAIECHSCYDWLLPALNVFRSNWPEVELDMVGGFRFTSLNELKQGEVDLVITSDPEDKQEVTYFPLFQYQPRLIMQPGHALADEAYVRAHHLKDATLITYPVTPERLDIYKCLLTPGGVEPAKIREVELTVMMVQLVASGRGVACLPNWAITEYLNQGFVVDKPLASKEGLWRTLYAAVREDQAKSPYLDDFIAIAQRVCHQHLQGIKRI